ncbi:hypothetical protein P5673_001115 [Acropora cervicornis]|uniref:Uncharacterized protein n=1 Tax=Acropora cervicornis TaxID=6130 RepID=A0AAD9R5M3_ACRCE|nr:hypothetical protein P5673_001115 [Acropora cervicornis]
MKSKQDTPLKTGIMLLSLMLRGLASNDSLKKEKFQLQAMIGNFSFSQAQICDMLKQYHGGFVADSETIIILVTRKKTFQEVRTLGLRNTLRTRTEDKLCTDSSKRVHMNNFSMETSFDDNTKSAIEIPLLYLLEALASNDPLKAWINKYRIHRFVSEIKKKWRPNSCTITSKPVHIDNLPWKPNEQDSSTDTPTETLKFSFRLDFKMTTISEEPANIHNQHANSPIPRPKSEEIEDLKSFSSLLPTPTRINQCIHAMETTHLSSSLENPEDTSLKTGITLLSFDTQKSFDDNTRSAIEIPLLYLWKPLAPNDPLKAWIIHRFVSEIKKKWRPNRMHH